MIILGMDPSAKMGLVVLRYEPFEEKVTLDHASEYSSKEKGMPRMGDIANKTMEMLTEHDPDRVAIEGYSFGSKFNHEFMYSIGTIIRYIVWQQEYHCREIPPTTLKKFVTGKGNAKKDLMMLNVFKNWGFDSNSDNICDAFAIALYALYQHLGFVDDKGNWKKGDTAHLKFDINIK